MLVFPNKWMQQSMQCCSRALLSCPSVLSKAICPAPQISQHNMRSLGWQHLECNPALACLLCRWGQLHSYLALSDTLPSHHQEARKVAQSLCSFTSFFLSCAECRKAKKAEAGPLFRTLTLSFTLYLSLLAQISMVYSVPYYSKVSLKIRKYCGEVQMVHFSVLL